MDVGDVREEFPLDPLVSLVAKRLSQTGSNSSPLSLFSFGFKVLMWMASKIFLGKSLGSLSNTFTFSQSMLCPLLRSTYSLIADLELAALDLSSAGLFSSLGPDSPQEILLWRHQHSWRQMRLSITRQYNITAIKSPGDAGRSGEITPVSVIICSVEV